MERRSVNQAPAPELVADAYNVGYSNGYSMGALENQFAKVVNYDTTADVTYLIHLYQSNQGRPSKLITLN